MINVGVFLSLDLGVGSGFICYKLGHQAGTLEKWSNL